MDDLARIFFPDNSNHRKAFLALWIEIKYAPNQFLSSQMSLTSKYGLSRRTLEVVRAKLKKMGVLKRISHFDPAYANHSGWTFADRFGSTLTCLAQAMKTSREQSGRPQDRLKDEQAFLFL